MMERGVANGDVDEEAEEEGDANDDDDDDAETLQVGEDEDTAGHGDGDNPAWALMKSIAEQGPTNLSARMQKYKSTTVRIPLWEAIQS